MGDTNTGRLWKWQKGGTQDTDEADDDVALAVGGAARHRDPSPHHLLHLPTPRSAPSVLRRPTLVTYVDIVSGDILCINHCL